MNAFSKALAAFVLLAVGSVSGSVRADLLPKELAEFERLATDQEVLVKIGAVTETALSPDRLHVLIWNIHKATDRDFAQDFASLAGSADLVLTQEAVHTPGAHSFLSENSRHEWRMATTFFFGGGIGTGVSTGAVAQPYAVGFVRAPLRELYLATPKIALFSTYRLKGMLSRLLVVNVHSLNMVDRFTFMAGIAKIEQAMRDHRGPILIAGDFNTWSPSRYAFLQLTALENGLVKPKLRNDERWLKLDHVFVRGLRVHDAELLSDISSSDHTPIFLEVSVERRSGEAMSAH